MGLEGLDGSQLRATYKQSTALKPLYTNTTIKWAGLSSDKSPAEFQLYHCPINSDVTFTPKSRQSLWGLLW